jgi:hypothetical protein
MDETVMLSFQTFRNSPAHDAFIFPHGISPGAISVPQQSGGRVYTRSRSFFLIKDEDIRLYIFCPADLFGAVYQYAAVQIAGF